MSLRSRERVGWSRSESLSYRTGEWRAGVSELRGASRLELVAWRADESDEEVAGRG